MVKFRGVHNIDEEFDSGHFFCSFFKPPFVKAITSLVVADAIYGVYRSIAFKWYITHWSKGIY